jgi:Zn finger protein HypA/HybF involved in hydrogenase expression
MKEDTAERPEVDALCRECGHAFKRYIDRVTSRDDAEPAEAWTTACPVCGCGNCRIGR